MSRNPYEGLSECPACGGMFDDLRMLEADECPGCGHPFDRLPEETRERVRRDIERRRS